jgi:hypothetical protein
MINIKEIIGSQYAIAYDDGKKIFTIIKPQLEKNENICFDFEGIEVICPPFLNSIFWSIISNFGEHALLSTQYKNCIDLEMVKLCIKNNIKFFHMTPEQQKEYSEIFERIADDDYDPMEDYDNCDDE